MKYYTNYPSPLGVISIASDGTHITGLWIENQKHFALPPNSAEGADIPALQQAKCWLDAYFSGIVLPIADIPLLPSGTKFQMQVWDILMKIPYGETVTYGQIASMLGKGSMSAQAVGNAVGRNPISILIPCHRVVGKDGSLTGYAGGIDKKAYLLQLERSSKQ